MAPLLKKLRPVVSSSYSSVYDDSSDYYYSVYKKTNISLYVHDDSELNPIPSNSDRTESGLGSGSSSLSVSTEIFSCTEEENERYQLIRVVHPKSLGENCKCWIWKLVD
ncbi:hypothetical protein Lal_00019302 [Lupinus albus]|nr:hypothetical protein Lal_00019302 [Lupinus albus]